MVVTFGTFRSFSHYYHHHPLLVEITVGCFGLVWLRYTLVGYFSETILREEVRFVRGFRDSIIGRRRGINPSIDQSLIDGGGGEHSFQWTAARDFRNVETAALDDSSLGLRRGIPISQRGTVRAIRRGR